MIPFNIGWVFVWWLLIVVLSMLSVKISKKYKFHDDDWCIFSGLAICCITGIIASAVHGLF